MMRYSRLGRWGGAWAVAAAFGMGCGAEESPEPVSVVDDPAAWERAFSEKDDAKADGTGCSGVRVPDQGDFGGRIALTFDDGPDTVHTPKIMQTLREHGAPATFFVLGQATQSDAARAVLADLVADPDFIVANHTWTHPNMATVDADRVASELDRATAALTAAGARPTFFRFPYGSSTCATAAAVRERGMRIVGWHIDSADWCFDAGNGFCRPQTFRHVPDAFRDDMIGFVLSQVRARNGGVLLFHDIKGYTARQLDALLTRLAEEGYTFVPLDDAETFPRLNGEAPRPTPFVGDPCAADVDCDFSANGARGFCLGQVCTLVCEGFCPDRAGKATTFCAAHPAPGGEGGVCVSRGGAENGHCADVPGTVDRTVARFVGASSARPAEALVCLPLVE